VPSSWGPQYKVDPASWEQSADPEITIPRGGRRRLKIASVLERPRAFWFYSGQWGMELPGIQWPIPDDEEPEITFALEVVNTGAADQIVSRNVVISIPVDPTRASAVMV
jgi:hypothetical protein